MGLRLRGLLWSGLYALAVLVPLAAAAGLDPLDEPRPFALELGVGLGFAAFAVIALELVLVSRLRLASELFGTDVLMLFHRWMGIAALVLVLAHAVLSAAAGPGLAALNPLAVGGSLRLGTLSGLAVVLLVASSLLRRRIGLAYERWQTLHLVGTTLAAAGMLAHAVTAGGYSRSPALRVVLVAYAALFFGMLLRYRVVRPLLLARRPWEVVENRDEGADTRTLVLRPAGGPGFAFRAGQFAWLVTGRSPLLSEQHPITISSSAERAPDAPLELTIKALGDWSRETVPALRTGARVWLDGPFGAFTPERFPFETLVLVAGGVGVTPMRSILATMRDRGDRRPVVLVYAASRPERAIWEAELARLERELPLRVVRVWEEPPPGWEGERGFVTAEVLRRLLPADRSSVQVFVCGPGPMMDALERALVELGVPPGRVQTERFDMV
jgi:predicted ferric reductase